MCYNKRTLWNKGGDFMRKAAWIRDRRTALRLSQQEAADRAGVSQTQWAKWEQQEIFKRESVKKIALALEMPLDEAMEKAGFLPGPPDVPAELVSVWERVPAEKRPQFLRLMREAASFVGT
jgi:transcriptional regulator with XRE-family HTH domain